MNLKKSLLVALVAGSLLLTQRAVASAASPDVVVVAKPFGAAVRVAPSSAASIAYVVACGDELTVTGEQDGWYQVYTHAGYYWVGGARVADPRSSGFSLDCRSGFTFQMQDVVESFVPTGCLSLRLSPARTAPFVHCVDNFHRYLVMNGPVEVAGEDWYEVWSATTGPGWALAAYLFPAS